MIYFWWRQVFEHPEVRQLQYYCRMDTDSMLQTPMSLDIFVNMREHKYIYGYVHQSVDTAASGVIDGLWRFIGKYLKENPDVMTTVKMNNWEVPSETELDSAPIGMYYNNFEVSASSEVEVSAFSDQRYCLDGAKRRQTSSSCRW